MPNKNGVYVTYSGNGILYYTWHIGVVFRPHIVVAGGNNDDIYVVWFGIINGIKLTNGVAGGTSEIFFTRSTDGGASFNKPITWKYSNNVVLFNNPSIAVSGNSSNNVYLVWTNNSTRNYQIYLAKSTDGGASFKESPLNVSHNTIGDSSLPRIAVSGNNVYVVWYDNSTRNYEIYLANSTDGGATFGKPINISHNAGASLDPIVAVSGNSVYAAWDDTTGGNHEIFFLKRSSSR